MHSAWTESEALQARHSSHSLGGARAPADPAEAASASLRQRSLERPNSPWNRHSRV